MNKEEHELRLKAAAYGLAAEKGVNEAIKALERLISELRDQQWNNGSGVERRW